MSNPALTTSVFAYSSARRFLIDQIRSHQEQTGASLRQIAREIDSRSHTWLVMVIKGQRKISLKHVPSVSRFLNLSSEESIYFKVLVQMDGADTEEERHLYTTWLSDLRPQNFQRCEEWDQAAVISDWLHSAILASTHLASVQPTTEKLVQVFQGKRDSLEVQSAVERLIALGLLIKNPDGRLVATSKNLSSRNDLTNAAVQNYHRKTSVLAQEAIEKQPVEEREYQSYSMAIPHDKIPLAKEAIRRFADQLHAMLCDGRHDELYQVNLQFFRLTEKPLHPKRSENEGAGTSSAADPAEKQPNTQELTL